MFILVGLEIRTLYRERAEHDREQEFARCQQLRSFESIADSLKSAITISQGQYQSTLKHVDGVLKTTEDVSRLAKKSLDNLTGGESFGYVIPNIGSTSDFHKATGAGSFLGFGCLVNNDGDQPLSGVTVTVSRILMNPVNGASRSNPAMIDAGSLSPLNIGTLPPHSQVTLPTVITPQLGPDGIARYLIFVSAQNGTAAEDLFFRKSNDGQNWDYKIRVRRQMSGAEKTGQYQNRTPVKTIKEIDWTEPPTQ